MHYEGALACWGQFDRVVFFYLCHYTHAHLTFSFLFLLSYLIYHTFQGDTLYEGEGLMRGFYFFILISHIILSVALIPLVLISYVRAFQKEFPEHKKISKITFPIWLYVAVTGVIVYIMIAPYY